MYEGLLQFLQNFRTQAIMSLLNLSQSVLKDPL